MGICKCRKRTDLFCFVHKKAVCEACICSDHQVCVVKSYFDWLSEPEYEQPVCGVCKGEVDANNMVRFLCLDMFHPECIDVYASSLPANTAMAGYTCPTCDKPILPAPGNTSVLALEIRKAFAHSPWAARVMGTPDEENVDLSSPAETPKIQQQSQENPHSSLPPSSPSFHPSLSLPSIPSMTPDTTPYTTPSQPDMHTTNHRDPLDPLSYHSSPPSSTTINIDQPSSTYGLTSHRKAPKPLASSGSMPYQQMDDEDEDKYRRKGFLQLFAALGLVSTPMNADAKRGVQLDMKKVTMLFAGFATLLIIYFLYNVTFSEEDPITTPID